GGWTWATAPDERGPDYRTGDKEDARHGAGRSGGQRWASKPMAPGRGRAPWTARGVAQRSDGSRRRSASWRSTEPLRSMSSRVYTRPPEATQSRSSDLERALARTS